ncbi:hypothetical protein N5P37_003777 [Trichoderma harzianum]|nr:hypothetical protein N5P37_003777 [Trichoderma harzianum]
MLPTAIQGPPPEVYEMWDFLFPGRYPPPLDVIITHEKKLERKEVMAEIQPLLLRLRGKWTEELNADIEATLTPEKLRVMDADAKALFSAWIHQQEDQKYAEWLKEAEEDMTSVTQDETTIVNGGDYWGSTLLMRGVLSDLKIIVETFSLSPEQKTILERGLAMLRNFIDCVEWHNNRGIKLPIMDRETLQFVLAGKHHGNVPNPTLP